MTFQNILIVKLSAIGDVIHALPVAHALKNCFPQAKVTWVVEKPALELVSSHPYIDEVIIFEKARCRSLSDLRAYLPGFVRQLKERKFDLTLDLQGLFKSGLIASLSGAPKRFVYNNTREFSNWMSKRVSGPNQYGHIVEQYLDVVRALGCSPEIVDFGIQFNEQEINSAKEILKTAGWQGESYVVLAPGANWPNKRWPTAHFAALIERLNEQDIHVVITGGPGDLLLAAEICSTTNSPVINVTGKTGLKQLAWIIKNAQVTVGGDTGPMHLSAAVKTPTVALMGPTDTKRNGPYGEGHTALVTPRECAGCWKRKCKKQLDCLEAITVEGVFTALLGLYREGLK